jgi:hypothetical protein
MENQLKLLAQLKIPQGTGSDPVVQINGLAQIPGNNIGGIINLMIPYIIAAAGFGLLVTIVMAGFTILTSAGDAKKMEMGKNQLTNAVIGAVVIFIAYWLTQLAGIILGIKEIKNIFP